MLFNNKENIYLQIVSLLKEKIREGNWFQEERIPSVRELGMELEVNPNTVLRAYEILEHEELIYSKRGLGYFVKEGAKENILKQQIENFKTREFPEMITKALQIGLSKKTLQELLNNKLNEKK